MKTYVVNCFLWREFVVNVSHRPCPGGFLDSEVKYANMV